MDGLPGLVQRTLPRQHVARSSSPCIRDSALILPRPGRRFRPILPEPAVLGPPCAGPRRRRQDDGLTRRQDCASRRFAEARPDCSSPRLLVVSSSSKAAPSPIVHSALCIVHCPSPRRRLIQHSAFSIQHCPAAPDFVDSVDGVDRPTSGACDSFPAIAGAWRRSGAGRGGDRPSVPSRFRSTG